MSDVALAPQNRGKPDPHHRHALGFQDRRSSPRSSWCRVRPSAPREIHRGRSASACSFPASIAGGASLSAASSGGSSVSTVLSSGFAAASALPSGLVAVRRLGLGVFLVGLLLRRFAIGRFGIGLLGRRLANRDAVVEAEHHHDGLGFLGGEDALGGGGPVGRIALGLISDQAGNRLVPADHAHIGLIGIGVLEAISEPVGHAIAEHQDVAIRLRSRASPAAAPWKNPRGPPASGSGPAAETVRTDRRRTSHRRRNPPLLRCCG